MGQVERDIFLPRSAENEYFTKVETFTPLMLHDTQNVSHIIDSTLKAINPDVDYSHMAFDYRTLAIAGYPIVNLLDKDLRDRCIWHIKNQGEKRAIIMRHWGRKNDRYFCYGDKTLITEMLRNYPRLWMRDANDFSIVVETALFKPDELPLLLGNQYRLKGKPTIVERKFVDPAHFKPTDKTLEHGRYDKPRPLVNTDLRKIKRLLQYYKHHSFYESYLNPQKYLLHMGIFDKLTELLDAMTGIIADVSLTENQKLWIIGDTVTRGSKRRQGLSSVLITDLVSKILSDEAKEGHFTNGLFIVDCNEASSVVTGKLGFEGTRSYYWTKFKRKKRYRALSLARRLVVKGMEGYQTYQKRVKS